MSRMYLVLIVAIFMSSVVIAKTTIEPIESFTLSEAPDYGVDVKVDVFGSTLMVSLSITSKFPCKVKSVSVAVFDGHEAILVAPLQAAKGWYSFQAHKQYMDDARIDFDCGKRTKEHFSTYILKLAGLGDT